MSRKVKIGNLIIGGGERIAVQTMSTKRLSDVENAVAEGLACQKAGCDILRYSVNDLSDAKSIWAVKKRLTVPIVADIHFDYKLALAAIDAGADKIRINPGNIGGDDKVREVALALKSAGIPVRVGSNTGSVEKKYLEKYGKNEMSLGESALEKAAILEKYGVKDIVLSVKASDVRLAVKAYEYVAAKCDYPLHIGITEAGTEYNGVIKNAIGIGSLLLKGIGDTIRVSLSANPEREVKAGLSILSALGLKKDGATLVACPTCGRCEWGCMDFAAKVEKYISDIKKPLKIAVMGCPVNGPGEAADADLGIAGAKGECFIFVKGKVLKKVPENQAEEVFFGEIDKCLR